MRCSHRGSGTWCRRWAFHCLRSVPSWSTDPRGCGPSPRAFHHPTRPHLDELDLSRTLELAAAALGDGDEPIVRFPRGSRVIPNRQRLAAVAVLGEREAHLSAVQRLALVDAAAWWLSEPNGGEEFAYALLAASCAAEITTEHVYLALITPSDELNDDGKSSSS